VITGGSASLLYFVATYLLVAARLAPVAASMFAWIVAFAAAYLVQRGWTFSGRHRHSVAFPRYLVAQFGCACVVALATQAISWIWRPSPLAISTGSAILSGALSYVISMKWVFRTAAPAAGDLEGAPRGETAHGRG
jgi:putative flippase GtrA